MLKALQTETCLFPLGGRADWPAKAPKNRHVFVWRSCVFSLDHSLRNGLDRAEVGLPGFCLIMFKICVASFYLTLGILNKLVFKPKIENWWVKGSHTRALTSLQWSSSLLWTSSSKLQTHEILSCIFWIWPMHEFCEHSRQHWISVFACSRGKCTIIRGLFHFGQGPWSRSLLLSSDWSFEGLIFGSDQRIYRVIDDCESFVILLFGMRQGEGGILFSDVPVAEGWSALARTSAESSPVLIFLRAPTSGRPVCIRMYSMYLWVVCIALYLYLFAFWRHSCSGFDSVWIFLEHPPYVCRRNWQYFEKMTVWKIENVIMWGVFLVVWHCRFVSQIVVHLVHRGHPGWRCASYLPTIFLSNAFKRIPKYSTKASFAQTICHFKDHKTIYDHAIVIYFLKEDMWRVDVQGPQVRNETHVCSTAFTSSRLSLCRSMMFPGVGVNRLLMVSLWQKPSGVQLRQGLRCFAILFVFRTSAFFPSLEMFWVLNPWKHGNAAMRGIRMVQWVGCDMMWSLCPRHRRLGTSD